MPREEHTYRAARRNALRSTRAAKLKAFRVASGMSRSEADAERNASPSLFATAFSRFMPPRKVLT